jgi:tetratricopeptide (TPR) repeat protein
MFFLPGSNIHRMRPQIILRILLFSLLISPAPAFAQSGGRSDGSGTGGSNTIRGRIYLPAEPRQNTMIKVKIESTNSPGLSTIADVDGAFVFRNLEPGPYYLTIDAGSDFEVFKDTVTIDRETSQFGRVMTVPVYLRLKPTSPLAAGTLDATLANVPKPALDRFNKARELSRTGNSQKAVEELKAAIAIYSEFALAYNELGVQYLKLGKLDPAIEALRSAVKLAPEAFSPHLNHGIALLNKKDFSQAEAELRKALKKNEASPTAHMYLGLTLINLRNHDEAEKELQRAAAIGGAEVSLAHYYLGGIYWGKREYKRAADELETYLRLAPQAPDADRVRHTIQELRSK